MTATMQNAPNSLKKTIRDARGRRLALQTLLGRGSFGKVYRAEDEESGEKVAAKFPLSEEDLGAETPSAELLELYGRLVREEAAQLKKMPEDLIPRGTGLVDGGGAVPCLLQEYFEDTLLERLHAGMNFAELCESLAVVCEALNALHAAGQTHGNLKPGNIFYQKGPDGRDSVRFSSPLTQAYLQNIAQLSARQPGITGWLPPEVLEGRATMPLAPWVDTFALGKLLYEAVVQPDAVKSSYSGRAGSFVGGIDKAAVTRFKGALAQRLLEDGSNPHVRDLLIRRATAMLNRALSAEIEPSPPYRFHSATELGTRLIELQELFHPGFAQLGQILLETDKATGSYMEGEEIRFSLSFRCHGGLEDIELITCMTYVRDLQADQKVKDAGIEVSPHHDGSRFRFSFRIPRLNPGNYLIRVALAIKGSPGKPVPRDVTIEVKASAEGKARRAMEEPPPSTVREPRIPAAPAAPPLVSREGRGTARDEMPAGLRPGSDAGKGRRSSEETLGDSGRPGMRPSSAQDSLTTLEEGRRADPRRPTAGTGARGEEPAEPRREDWTGVRETPRAGRDLVWMAEEDRVDKGRSGAELEPLSSRPIVDTWEDDKPARLRVDAREMDDKPARVHVEAREMDDKAPRVRVDGRDVEARISKPRIDVRDLEVRASRPPAGGRDMDDAPAKIRVTGRDLDDAPARSGSGRDLDEGPARLKLETGGRSDRKRFSAADETVDMPNDEIPGIGGGQNRARIEPAAVGRDAVRHSSKDKEAVPASRGDSARRSAAPVVGPAADRGRSGTAGAGSSSTSRDPRSERDPRGEREPRTERDSRTERDARGERDARTERDARGERDARTERDSRGERDARTERDPRGERDRYKSEPSSSRASVPDRSRKESPGKPGEQFIPELYYKEARGKAMPGEEDDEFFQRGAIKPQQYAVIMAALAGVLLILVLAIVSVWFENFYFMISGIALVAVAGAIWRFMRGRG